MSLLEPLRLPFRSEMSETFTPGTYQGRRVGLSNVFQLVSIVSDDLKEGKRTTSSIERPDPASYPARDG